MPGRAQIRAFQAGLAHFGCLVPSSDTGFLNGIFQSICFHSHGHPSHSQTPSGAGWKSPRKLKRGTAQNVGCGWKVSKTPNRMADLKRSMDVSISKVKAWTELKTKTNLFMSLAPSFSRGTIKLNTDWNQIELTGTFWQ